MQLSARSTLQVRKVPGHGSGGILGDGRPPFSVARPSLVRTAESENGGVETTQRPQSALRTHYFASGQLVCVFAFGLHTTTLVTFAFRDFFGFPFILD